MVLFSSLTELYEDKTSLLQPVLQLPSRENVKVELARSLKTTLENGHAKPNEERNWSREEEEENKNKNKNKKKKEKEKEKTKNPAIELFSLSRKADRRHHLPIISRYTHDETPPVAYKLKVHLCRPHTRKPIPNTFQCQQPRRAEAHSMPSDLSPSLLW